MGVLIFSTTFVCNIAPGM